MKPGIQYALLAALLFGASTPISKTLLKDCPPVILAGLLYLGSGIGLALISLKRKPSAFNKREWGWLLATVFFGGILAPISLLIGLSSTSGSTASLLLNFEGVFTALLAWFAFKENFDKRIILGMVAIVAGGLLLSWDAHSQFQFPVRSLGIIGACLCWALDNNLTRKISNADSIQIAKCKGLIAGIANLGLGLFLGMKLPSLTFLAEAGIVGFISYGVSMALFVLALRHLGASRTTAYFSTAPFIGVILSILFLHEIPSMMFWVGAGMMGMGVWLHLTERHEHEHTHEQMEHEHLHFHDEHHQHEHLPTDPKGEPHSHPHRHAKLTHSHPHYPDIHHQHSH